MGNYSCGISVSLITPYAQRGHLFSQFVAEVIEWMVLNYYNVMVVANTQREVGVREEGEGGNEKERIIANKPKPQL